MSEICDVCADLLEEFSEGLKETGEPKFEILERCPEGLMDELLSLMSTALLLHRQGKKQQRSERPSRVEGNSRRLGTDAQRHLRKPTADL